MNRTPRIGIPPATKSGGALRHVGIYERAVKPGVDIAAGFILSVLTLPIVLIAAMVATAAFKTSGIGRFERVGKDGVPFNLYRIRTGDVAGRRHRVSKFMTRWSFDELPQLWNVALGHMSLVGPRPISPAEADTLKDWQLRRHEVKPGLTGLWQVGARGDGRELLDNLHYDIQYIDQLSLATDLGILGITLGAWATRREGDHVDSGRSEHGRSLRTGGRLIATDLALWPFAITAAVYARFDFSFATFDWEGLMLASVVAVAVQAIWGAGVGLYRGRWRLGSFEEAIRVATGAAIVTVALLLTTIWATSLIPTGAVVGAGSVYLASSFALRYAARSADSRHRRANHQRVHRLLVFGAGRAGTESVGALLEDRNSSLEPVAFLDDDAAKWGSRLLGLPVIAGRDAIASVARRYDADSLLVAMPSADPDQIRRVSDLAVAAGLPVEVVPPVSQSLSSLLVAHARSAPAARAAERRPVERRAPRTGPPVARDFDLAVIGLGYVGLPAVIAASEAGLRVAGLDIDPAKIESLLKGSSYIEDIPDEEVAEALAGGFRPTGDASLLARADVITISVPTPLRDGLPDLNAVIGASEAIGDHLNPGQTVVLESTTYPGTTDDVVRPILEERSGLKAGVDFYLAYSPERIDPGNQEWGVHNTPKLVGGFDQESAEKAAQLYRKFAPVVVMSGTREAEMAKLLENTYRHVNIALINEMAVFADLLAVDIWETIRGAATKPFGFQAFYPGPGVGGHCIPIDPNYLSYRVRQLGSQFKMIELAQEINDYMPSYVAKRAMDLLTMSGVEVAGSSVLVLGVAYKPDVGDVRETPATSLVRALRSAGVRVLFADPLVPRFLVDDEPVERVDDPISGSSSSDLVIIHTPHNSFDLDQICVAAPLVLDTRGVTSRGQAERL